MKKERKKALDANEISILTILQDHNVMDAFQASAKRSGGKCNWNCIYPCVCITLCTPPTRRDLAAEWEKRECRTGDAPVSLKPDVWKRFSFTCTMRWKREKALTDKNNNNWFIPTPGLFFRANCYCKILAFTSIIVKVSWKNSAMDVLLRYN